MPEYRIFQTCILPYKGRIYDPVLLRENAGKRKPVFRHTLGINLGRPLLF